MTRGLQRGSPNDRCSIVHTPEDTPVKHRSSFALKYYVILTVTALRLPGWHFLIFSFSQLYSKQDKFVFFELCRQHVAK